jgi:hypothetical protein
MYSMISSSASRADWARLLRGPEQPFAAQVSGDLLVRNHTPGLAVRDTSTDRLHHVQGVLHVVQAAVVWQAIE